jgi:phage gp36-like protein
MTYATLQDLIDRFGERELVQRTDRVNRPPTTIDTSVVDQALEGASSLADGYLLKVYKLPLASPAPRALVDKVSDIARYNLRDESADKDSTVVRNYQAALAWLRDVANGVVTLDVGAGEEPEAAGGGGVRSTSGPRTFTPDSLKGFV